RVPTPTVLVIDFTAVLSKNSQVAENNAAMKEYAEGPMKGILAYSEEPLVSSDLKGDEHSSIFSALDTLAVGGNLVKVVAWYDNEMGYSVRVADLVQYVIEKRERKAASLPKIGGERESGVKVGIGGSGFVGATAGYALVMHGVGREIVLVDKNTARAAAEA